MPPVDPSLLPPDWQKQQQAFQPQPFPGAQPMPKLIPRGANQAAAEQERLRLANEAAMRTAANEAERLRLAREQNAREEAKAAREEKKAEISGGVEASESERKAAFLTTQLAAHEKRIDEIFRDHPDEIKPGWIETIGGLAGERGRALATQAAIGSKGQDIRNELNNRYQKAVDAALTLGTGAAYPVEQKAAYVESLAPQVTDGPETLADKRRQLRETVIAARISSGAANAQVDRALAEIDKIYSKAGAPIEKDFKETKELSSETKAVELPKGYPDEHQALVKSYPKGKLTVADYKLIRRQLASEFGNWGGEISDEDAATVVDFYNKTGKVPVPVAEEPINAVEKVSAAIGADTGLAGDIYSGAKNYASAMTLGVPDLLAGEENRKASELSNAAHSKSALTGQIAGSLIPSVTLEKLAAKGLIKLGTTAGSRAERIGADMLANAGYGGITEANQAGGDLREGLEGATYGAGGSLVGRGVSKGLKEFKPKQFSDDLALLGPEKILNDAGEEIGKIKGVDLTTPQRVGATRAEEFVEGFPGVSGQRQKAVDDWNRHNSARVLAKVGRELPKDIQPGQHANAFVHQALGEEYQKIAPQIKGTVNKDFKDGLAVLKASVLTPKIKGRKVPDDVKEMWQHLEDAASSMDVKGKFDYDSYKKFSQQVREWQRFWASSKIGTDEIPSPVMNEMARKAEDLLALGRKLVTDNNPAAGAKLKKIDTAWRHQMINDIASLGAAKQNRGVASPAEWLNAVERMDFSKNKSATAQGKAFEQPYGQAAMDILGKKPARGGSVIGTGALGYTVGGTVLSPALIAAYGPGVKRLTQLLTDGKLGGRMDDLMPERIVAKYPELKELPSDLMKQVIASYIREKATNAGEQK